MRIVDKTKDEDFSDIELWQEVLAGGRRQSWGIEVLYKRYAQELRLFFLRACLNEAQARDLVQDVFIKILKTTTQYDENQTFQTWLRTVAFTTYANYLRDLKRSEKFLIELTKDEFLYGFLTGSVEHTSSEEELGQCIENSFIEFSKNSPERAHALSLFTLKNVSLKELAKVIGRTEGATREYLSQCRKKIRPFLEHCRIYLGEQI